MEQQSDYLKRPDATGHQKVLEVLRRWDPIGVISESNQDEYDCYASRVIRMLDDGCTPKELANVLYNLKTNEMGLFGFGLTAEEQRVAKELVVWWNARQESPPSHAGG